MQDLTYFETVAVILYDSAINFLAKLELLPDDQIVWIRNRLEVERQGPSPDRVRALAGHMVDFCNAELKDRGVL